MQIIRSSSNNPQFNLATEEYLLKQKSEDFIMLWINNPCVVIGRNQNPYAEVNLNYANGHNIPVIRRITGGGTVYHDINNINFSFIQTRPDIENLDFSLFTNPIINLLKKNSLNATASRNDILVDGYKVSGNAQLIYNHRILHHGTLLFETNINILKKVLTPNPIKLEKKFIASNVKETRNINSFFKSPLSTSAWFDQLSDFFIKEFHSELYTLSETDNREILSIVDNKYNTKSWTFPIEDNYQYKSETYCKSGLLQIFYSVENLRIAKLKIMGDFFALNDIKHLESILIGTNLIYDDIFSKLNDNNAKSFINNLDIEEFASLFFNNHESN